MDDVGNLQRMAMGWEIKGKESSNERSDDLADSDARQADASDPLAYFRGNFDVDTSLEAPQRNGEAAPAGNPVVKLREPNSMTKSVLVNYSYIYGDRNF
jgi:hypothetical protein